jgi:hypothetical protein
LRRSQHFPYKTLGITSLGSFEKQFSTRAAPVSGLPAEDGPAEVVLTNEREKTRTVSNTGAGNASSPIIFLTGWRRPASMFLATVRLNAGTIAQPSAIPFVSGGIKHPHWEKLRVPARRTHVSTGGIKRIIAREPEKITHSRKQISNKPKPKSV